MMNGMSLAPRRGYGWTLGVNMLPTLPIVVTPTSSSSPIGTPPVATPPKTSTGSSTLASILGTINTAIGVLPYYFLKNQPAAFQGNQYGTNPYTVGANQNAGAGIGAGIGSIGDVIAGQIYQHPLLFLSAGVLLVFWFLPSPRKR